MPVTLPPWLVLDPLLRSWLQEDVGRGDVTTQNLDNPGRVRGHWRAKADGVIAGLPVAARVFHLLDATSLFTPLVPEGAVVSSGTTLATVEGPLAALLAGERVSLNLVMRLSGVATLTQRYVAALAPWPTRLVDTRKTTPGLRVLEKYAVRVGGGSNHRLGLDDAVLIKDNHIAAAGGIRPAVAQIRQRMPYVLRIEVEVESLEQVREALDCGVDALLLDNMALDLLQQAVPQARQQCPQVMLEASGNITLEKLGAVAATGVDYISTSATITQAPWLDLSMRLDPQTLT